MRTHTLTHSHMRLRKFPTLTCVVAYAVIFNNTDQATGCLWEKFQFWEFLDIDRMHYVFYLLASLAKTTIKNTHTHTHIEFLELDKLSKKNWISRFSFDDAERFCVSLSFRCMMKYTDICYPFSTHKLKKTLKHFEILYWKKCIHTYIKKTYVIKLIVDHSRVAPNTLNVVMCRFDSIRFDSTRSNRMRFYHFLLSAVV